MPLTSNQVTQRMIAAYFQDATPQMFLSGMFQTPPANLHSSEEVSIDIERSEEEVSPVISDLSAGHNYTAADTYVNKAFKPPIHKDAGVLNAFDLITRQPGQDPFQDPDFQANAMERAFRKFRKLEYRIRRAIELQASQVLQTGVIELFDNDGNKVYTLDYQARSDHFPTAAEAWGTADADSLSDLKSLGSTIRTNGLAKPDMAIMGIDAFDAFIQEQKVRDLLDNRRIDLGAFQRMEEMVGEGGEFRGSVDVGNYQMAVWTYDGRYKDPETGDSKRYLDPAKVIVRDSGGRLDATFGAIPRIVQPDQRVMPFLPGRLASPELGMDIHTNAWVSPDGENLHVAAGSRPLMIPTAIDRFGCLDTQASS